MSFTSKSREELHRSKGEFVGGAGLERETAGQTWMQPGDLLAHEPRSGNNMKETWKRHEGRRAGGITWVPGR